jgi:hypothetical protein
MAPAVLGVLVSQVSLPINTIITSFPGTGRVSRRKQFFFRVRVEVLASPIPVR